MGAVWLKTRADLRHRRLQSTGIGLVLFLSTATATLALSILVESQAPFDHAFEAANGAHLVVRYGGDVDPGRLDATAAAAPVTASAGPWPVAEGVLGDPQGGRLLGVALAGRPRPDPSIDNVTVLDGRWWEAPGEVVLDDSIARLLRLTIGQRIAAYPPPTGEKSAGNPLARSPGPLHELTVVGIAGSVSTPDIGGWMSPVDIEALVPEGPPEQEMLYRVAPSASAADLAAAIATIAHELPADAVRSSRTYLDVKAEVDQLANLYVPVLLAFSTFALLAAAFLIANVVTGIVLTSYRDIGVMKAVGFTPRQVTLILVGQVFAPAALGSIVGVLLGTIASQPVIRDTAASFGLAMAYSHSLPVVATVVGIALLTCLVAALVPAVRAGRISAVEAMTRGGAPSRRPDGGRLRRLGLAVPVGLPGRLGISAGLAHPGRATMMLGALVVGVAAATFAVGLDASLVRVITALERDTASPVRIDAATAADGRGKGGGATTLPAGPADPSAITAAVIRHSETARSVAIGQLDVSLPGMAPLPFVGYDGDAGWLGYELIEGTWFAGPGEAVAPTNFFTLSGLHVGETTTISAGGRSLTVRLVGEVFDTPDESREGLVLRGPWSDLAALDPLIRPNRWEAQPLDGVDPQDYRSSLQDAIGLGARVWVVSDSLVDASFVLFLGVIGLMGLVLVGMSLGGVFNTVLLETRQRTREVAVLKAIGLTPAQVVAMVVATVVPVGLVAGLVGVPIGILAQRLVLMYMGEVAARTRVPEQVFDVFPLTLLIGFGLTGLAIGALGAYLPAQRAARASIAPVLQAE